MKLDSLEFVQEPCDDAERWMKSQRSLKSAWKNCKHGTWMLWAILFSTKATKLTEEQKDALVVWLRKNIYASASAYAYADAYSSVYASAYAYADADADGKIANWIRANIEYPL